MIQPVKVLLLLLIHSTTTTSAGYIHATLQTFLTSQDVGDVVESWQLYSVCSKGFIQHSLSEVNANGRMENDCLTKLSIRKQVEGPAIYIQHADSGHYFCLDVKGELVMMKTASLACAFREHLTRSGYSKLESAHQHGLFLGVDQQGHFYSRKWPRQRCFRFSKLVAPARPTRDCAPSRRRHHRFSMPQISDLPSNSLFGILKDMFLQKVTV